MPTPNHKVRAAIIGYGRSGRLLHAGGLRANPAFDVAAISSLDPASIEQAKADFPCPVFSDYRKMLAEIPLDLCVIVTRNDQHAAMACDCLAAGAHVLVTKPMGVDAAEIRSIIAAADAAGRTAFPFLPSRWGSDFRRIREIVQNGEIGEVFCIRRGEYGFATRDDWQTQSRFGGGILLNWGPHLVEPPILLAGGRPVAVHGSHGRLLNPGDAEDNFHAVIAMENGVRVHAEWSFSPRGLPNWYVQGTRGVIIAHGQKLEIISGTPQKPADPTDFKAMQGKPADCRTEEVGEHLFGDSKEVYADFARALTTGEPFGATANDALQIARILDAIRTSGNEQRVVTL